MSDSNKFQIHPAEQGAEFVTVANAAQFSAGDIIYLDSGRPGWRVRLARFALKYVNWKWLHKPARAYVVTQVSGLSLTLDHAVTSGGGGKGAE